MKHITKAQTNIYKNSEACIAVEYPLQDKDINIATITLAGRYPNTGRVMNTVCKEIAYIIKGSGKIIIDDQTIPLSEGDVILIEPNEKYYWEGDLEMIVPDTPAWYPEQHQIINEDQQ